MQCTTLDTNLFLASRIRPDIQHDKIATDMTRIIASVEARMSSSRLPGKMMMDIEGKPAIIRVLDRLKMVKQLDDIILATTVNPADDVLAEVADVAGYKVYRGSENDVLRRVVDAQQTLNSDVVVEICGDCPLIDPAIIEDAVETFLRSGCDIAAVGKKESYPQGLEVQVFSLKALLDIANNIKDPAVREHVSLYFFENPEIYTISYIQAPDEHFAPDLRLLLDYEEDLQLIREVYASLSPIYGDEFGVGEILELFSKRPRLSDINRHCQSKLVR